ncbi:hypothetical protein GCM10007382_02770 [Salinibacterium xinjiangense]|uniref:Uncharacterized protein n=2 Tax=Salinibacterium xinjiangense TaxID=386302 RepID=A0A2C8ZNF4_9MICO|nr:hypothetical protein [Salinibacterium xinjiangense]GGK86195.1 hypothetical protein GCM10007382_02770 [Salinibacterium xinjiangense]SOE66640.1 hypothetical protein SAMN06296378_1769 [Salinibacterium xinjiangense]
MLGAILLVLIGSADLARAGISAPLGRVLAVAVAWLAVVLLATLGLGIAGWWVAIPVLMASAWLGTTTTSIDRRMSPGILPAVGVLLSLLAFLVWDRTSLGMSGFIVDWHVGVISTVISSLPLSAIAVAVGVTLFAIESANLTVRAALRPATAASRPVIVPVSRSRWWKRTAAPALAVADLRGGRLIGPVERVLIIALTLAGALPIVAGLLAAKGIVRFPEISSDGAGGSKAEYFLVGSLVSWAIAVAGAGLIWISVAG